MKFIWFAHGRSMTKRNKIVKVSEYRELFFTPYEGELSSATVELMQLTIIITKKRYKYKVMKLDVFMGIDKKIQVCKSFPIFFAPYDGEFSSSTVELVQFTIIITKQRYKRKYFFSVIKDIIQ